MNYDLIIIGTGAGGGTLLHALAPSGLKILVLERGDFVPREKQNWDPTSVFVEQRYTTEETWLDDGGKHFRPGMHYYVGGNTKFYGAALLRMRERDFDEVVHGGGVSPAWPLSYADFEPYYTRAEHLYHVHGKRGIDPTDPPASAEYPDPPVSDEPRIAEFRADLQRLGLHPFPLPMGIMLDEAITHASACIRCDTCDGFACLVNAKSDADIVAVRPSLAFENVTLLTGAYVKRLLTSPTGREVSGVVVERGGAEETYRAHVVVVACGAINSAALLLRSASEQHPSGLANGSDVVGRNYMAHNNAALVAVSKRRNDTRFEKTLGVNDFYFESGETDWPYPLGHFAMLGKSHAAEFRGDAPGFVPNTALAEIAGHALDLWITTEDLPDPNNRVEVERDGTIRLRYHENNLEAHRRLVAKLKNELLEHLGCERHLFPNALYLGKKIPLAGVAHQNGTIRLGTDPATSALDTNCKAHELDNLYVVDGSFFPSSSAVNPALTIIANALRVAEHLATRLGTALGALATA
jgi:choline dehydrogenase-like flavoprotein